MTKELNDRLDDLLGGSLGEVRTAPVREAPAFKPADKRWVEGCPRCRGTGMTPWGVCFRCKGAKGKTFKTSPETRAANRMKSSMRKEKRAAELAASLEAAFASWKAANPEIAAWLDTNAAKGNAFAISLLAGAAKFGGLTDGQKAAVERSLAKEVLWAAERAKAASEVPAVDAGKIETAFATARAKAARPGMIGVMVKPIKLTSGKITIRFSPGSIGSKWEGMLFAKDEASGKKLGSIKDGRFTKRFECTEAEAAAVLDCVNDPEKAAVAFGKAWSRCGICGKGLLNDESIARGIGPICAERFGW